MGIVEHRTEPAAGSAWRVRKAYEQVADQLRTDMATGELAPDQRLPSEAALSLHFGVSRATIREALRVLSSHNLIRTSKGQSGGSFVPLPTVDHISESMSTSINLLCQSDRVTLDELIEARELVEIPAVRLAARRRTSQLLERLWQAIPDEPLALGTDQQFIRNRDFHATLMLGTGNVLLSIAADPVFAVLQTHLRRSMFGSDYHARINSDHRAIAAAVEAGDEDAAAEEMQAHLAYLRPQYEAGWSTTHRC
jgi:DNA-binding FadR family transcriptional regulator